MTAYSTLIAAKTTDDSIKNWLNRADLPVTAILTEAQAEIYQRLRVREMMTDEAFSFASAASSKALSTLSGTFLDPVKFVPYQWGEELPYVNPEFFNPGRDEDGALFEASTPSRWCIIGETAHIDVLLSAAFAGRMMYYAQLAALGLSNETNFLTTRYPSLLRHACMWRSYAHMKDAERTREYKAYMMADIAEANQTNDMFRRGSYAGN